ncbi:hypothetical protein BK004_03785 [bacterium CG10_46_32]|nr:MAG: hypothetical protein BK004_03785 [bacterium CG10_46_32]PIR55914.1 MAG: hypothetical protein COU73_03815 [Parcubacteria group bacterium CG10_big_fil_rev_8_21_14_0_10_46_32]
METRVTHFFLSGWRPYLWLFAVIFALYSQTLFFNFTYLDDQDLIINNYSFLSDISNIGQAFKEDVFFSAGDAYYRPLLTVSFMLDAQMGGMLPAIYHASNILFHGIVAMLLLLFFITLGYRREPSFLAALFFAVHPMLTQAVAWVPGRNDSLLAVFILAAFIFLFKFLESNKAIHYSIHLLFFAAALLIKETAALLPVVALVYIWFIRKESFFTYRQQFLVISWFAIGVGWLLARHLALGNIVSLGAGELVWSLLANLPAFLQLLGKALFPFNLSVLPIIQDTTFLYGIIALVFLVFGFLHSRHKRLGFLLFGSAWLVLFLLPSFIRADLGIVADFVEHRMYVPVIGLLIVLLEVTPLKNFSFNKKATLLPAAAVIILFATITVVHSRDFSDHLTFWRSAAVGSPHSPLAHRNLGAMYYLDGMPDQAEPEYQKALALNPTEKMAHNNLGLIYAHRGEYQKAEAEYKDELTINPYYDNALFNLGLLYSQTDRKDEAAQLWLAVLAVNPRYVDAYYFLAKYYYENGDMQKAQQYAQPVGLGLSSFK